MSEQSIIIRFPGVDKAEANRMAAELREFILDSDANAKAEQRRDDVRDMDFGATLVLVLGTPAVLTVAKGIHAWLAKRNAAEISIGPNGSVSGKNLTSKDAVSIVEEALRASSKQHSTTDH